MSEGKATIRWKDGGGYRLDFGVEAAERVTVEEPEDIVSLAEAMGCGTEMASMKEREAVASAHETMDGAIYAGDTVSRANLASVR